MIYYKVIKINIMNGTSAWKTDEDIIYNYDDIDDICIVSTGCMTG